MMFYIRKIDNSLIDDFFQRISDFIHGRIGLNCFWIAKIMLVLSTCLELGSKIAFEKNDWKLPESWPWLTFFLLVRIGFFIIYDHLVKTNTREGFANSIRNDSILLLIRMISLIGLVSFPLSTPAFLLYLSGLLYVSSIYFLCCNLLPPSRKTVKTFADIPTSY